MVIGYDGLSYSDEDVRSMTICQRWDTFPYCEEGFNFQRCSAGFFEHSVCDLCYRDTHVQVWSEVSLDDYPWFKSVMVCKECAAQLYQTRFGRPFRSN